MRARLGLQQNRIVLAQESVLALRERVAELEKTRDANDVPVFKISSARTDLDQAEAHLIDQIVALSGDGGLKIGAPLLSGAVVTAKVVGATQGPKLVVQKFRRRKNYRRRTGHRQKYTQVKIGKILA